MNYIGIDLGTTNSAICSFDSVETRIWKSPEQNDVTPSVIYYDKRGNKYIGKRAYDSAPYSPGNSAMLFKRLMGTSTPIEFSAISLTKTPEECSAEVLKVLFGYLPEEIRNDKETGTVITVPAAFNQMQKDATMQAAKIAGIGKVALMQEPVAAVMSVMKSKNADGMFLVFDLGGGTLDIAIAEGINGHVSLLAHGGIAMCGGRDFDRVLLDNIIKPWLHTHFKLPDDLSVNPSFTSLLRLAAWAAERAKIELSSREEVTISLSETEARTKDIAGTEVFLDIPLQRTTYDKLIASYIADAVSAARDTLAKTGLTPHDIERIVFIGGPTNYKPLRDKVAYEMGIPGGIEVNPMTAVAEGASLFAESIDWTSHNHSRKNTRGKITSHGKLSLSFLYAARTPESRTKVSVQISGNPEVGTEFQIDSVNTGWTSGRIVLLHGTYSEVPLPRAGENSFKIFIFDSNGGPISLEQDIITINRTAAAVDAIPISHSVGIEVLEKLGGGLTLDYLARAGDSLPIKGSRIFKSAESLKAGAPGSYNFKLWEGEIENPISDNRPIGLLKIAGTDFDTGIIPAGADLVCDFEILDSGNIILEVSVPCIGGTFQSGRNFYSRREGQLDFSSDSAFVIEEGEKISERINSICELINDPKLDQAKQKLEKVADLDPNNVDTERAQAAMEEILSAKSLLAQVRKDHQKEIRQMDYDNVTNFFNEYVRQHARASEASAFDNLAKTAQRSIDRNDRDFEHHLDELKGKNFEILWRQDWFVIDRFKRLSKSSYLYTDKNQYEELTLLGNKHVRDDDMDELRNVVAQLESIKISNSTERDIYEIANIIRG